MGLNRSGEIVRKSYETKSINEKVHVNKSFGLTADAMNSGSLDVTSTC
jgi:hypothetical protein